jgi:tetratricopeptide (TPR) repeat protein
LERAESVVAPIPLLAGLIAGALACLARNLTDSDWYIPAIGLVFWMVIGLAAGIGRKLIAPETAAPATGKRLSLVVVVVTLLLIAAIAVTDIAAYHAQKGDALVEDDDRIGYVSAYHDYHLASLLAPLSAEYHLKCAKADMASLCKPWESAEREVRVAARLEPTNPTPHMILADIKFAAGSKRDALASCRQAERRDPKSPSVKIAIADVLQALGKRDEALQVYRQVLDIEKTPYEQVRAIPELVDPNYAFAHFELGKAYEERGEPRQAIEEYRAAVKRIERRNSFKTMLEIERIAGGDPALNRRANAVLAESRSRLARLGS